MCRTVFLKRIASFILTLTLGSAVVSFLRDSALVVNQKTVKPLVSVNQSKHGIGSGFSEMKQFSEKDCFACKDGKEIVPSVKSASPQYTRAEKNSLKIISKPRPEYTDDARENLTQGRVILLITFLASGEIGAVAPVNNLPNGLTEQAVAAAKKIKFQPAIRNGKPISIKVPVEYNFILY